ncbi:MAG: DNA polymerase III subunit beta [candidate division NC10 bacterium RBG_16_65_8]|nr:MAG: DNA polymerase III subunit beta [candidate division NC10 bacterium RBG_16_65_8]
MHIRIERDTFVDALGPVQGVVEVKKALPILSHVLLDATPEGLSLFGTDLDVGLRKQVAAEVLAPGAITLLAKKLYEVVKELPSAPIELRADPDLQVAISCQRSNFRLKGLSREEFPSLPDLRGDGELLLDAKLFRDMLRKTIFAVSSDQTRYALTGVLLQAHSTGLNMVATDGHRLALVRLPRPETSGTAVIEALIPKKAMVEAVKIARDEVGNVRIRLSDNQLVIEQDTTTLVARLIDGQFPNYDQVVPAFTPNQIDISKDALHGALRRTSAIMGERTTPTEFDFQAGRVLINCVNMDLGEAHEEVEISYTGEGVKIGFNARYILEFLSAVDSEIITLHLTDPLSPAIFRSAGDERYSCVIMPMRI